MIQIEEEQWRQIKAELQELRAWNQVAVESNKAIGNYLKKINPELPEHYGMPLDGIRQTIKYILKDVIDRTEIDSYNRDVIKEYITSEILSK